MKHRLIIVCIVASLLTTVKSKSWTECFQAPTPPCVASPCQFSTNIAWDTTGKRLLPPLWGTGDSLETRIPFVNVPVGYHVSIIHASGDQIAAPHGVPTPGTVAYTLVGLTNTTPNQSPYVAAGLGSMGCFLYKQVGLLGYAVRIPIDEAISNGDLNADNVLILKQALYLDEFGDQAPVHMEATLVLQFLYVVGAGAPGGLK
jgi:hypothetical protein